MTVLGLRASTKEIRYVLLDKDDSGNIIFVNRSEENRIKYPANIDQVEEKLEWVKSEIDRILRINSSIERIIIKTNEYGRETSATRETTYIDAMFMLAAKEKGIPVVRKLNSQIGSTSAKARELAETSVGRTEKYWNNTIADAVLVAYWGINNV